MEALALMFGLFLVVLLGLVALGALLTALQGITLAFEADRTLGFISVILIFPLILFGAVYWINGTKLPQKFMDDLREKQRKDEGREPDPEPEDHQPENHQPEKEPDLHDAGGDMHDSADHHFVGDSPTGSTSGDASIAAAAEADAEK